ncbi:hypothetical protein ACFL27_23895 [candidate division CSSED10-310 bacterium]|uniref:Outer membrane protein beta-barrel domain-containing protein n=1 Tax=candidate division CSSED10-310 bacterium TaxID=2855610 RepID=A0ABV6Z479_UNCC1
MQRRSKVLIMVLIGFCFLWGSSRESQAIEAINLGLKYWYPTWELDGYSDFGKIEWETDTGMFGPGCTFIFTPRFALSLSFFQGSFSYPFPNAAYLGDNTDADWSSNRTDVDIIPAFLIGEHFNIFVGLKYLAYDQTIEGTWYGTGNWQIKYDLEGYGPGFGVGFNFPIGSTPVTIYSTLSAVVLLGNFETSGTHNTGSKATLVYPIGAVELGARYSLTRIPLQFMLSYRYQRSQINFDWEEEDSTWDSLDENFSGLILYAGYSFVF